MSQPIPSEMQRMLDIAMGSSPVFSAPPILRVTEDNETAAPLNGAAEITFVGDSIYHGCVEPASKAGR
jgi:hypothetical protein